MKVYVILLILMLQYQPSIYYTHYVFASDEILIDTLQSGRYYESFPVLSLNETPEGYTYYDLGEIIFLSISIHLLNHSGDGEATFEFTRFQNGEPYLSYYLVPTLEDKSSAYLNWSLPYAFHVNETWEHIGYTIEVTDFEIEFTAYFDSGEWAEIVIETEWILTWIQREEPVPLVVKVIDAIFLSLIGEAIMLVYLFFLMRWKRKQESKRFFEDMQEKRRNERRERRYS